MATAPTVVNHTARAPDNVIFFDQAVWVDEGTRWTPGFLKRIHLTGIQEAAAWRLLPFEVHFLHNLRGRRMHGLGIGAFTPAICGTSGAAAKSKMFELASIGPSAFAAAQESPLASAKQSSSASSAAEKNNPLVKIRKLGDKDRQEVTSAFPVISKWHASHGQRHLKWLPHSLFAGITIEVDLDENSAAIAANDDRCHAESLGLDAKTASISKGKNQSSSSARSAPPAPRRQRLLLLAVDPLQSHAPLITWPPRYLTPKTPVRILSYEFKDLDLDADAESDAMMSGDEHADKPWHCIGEYRLLGSLNTTSRFADLRTAVNRICAQRVAFEKIFRPQFQSFKDRIMPPLKANNPSSKFSPLYDPAKLSPLSAVAKSEANSASVSSSSSTTQHAANPVAWIIAWRPGMAFPPHCFLRRHWNSAASCHHMSSTYCDLFEEFRVGEFDDEPTSVAEKTQKSASSSSSSSSSTTKSTADIASYSTPAAKFAMLHAMRVRWNGVADEQDGNDTDLDDMNEDFDNEDESLRVSDDESDSDETDSDAEHESLGGASVGKRKRSQRGGGGGDNQKRGRKGTAAVSLKITAKSKSKGDELEAGFRREWSALRTRALEQRAEWAQWARRVQKPLRGGSGAVGAGAGRRAACGNFTLFERMERPPAIKFLTREAAAASIAARTAASSSSASSSSLSASSSSNSSVLSPPSSSSSSSPLSLASSASSPTAAAESSSMIFDLLMEIGRRKSADPISAAQMGRICAAFNVPKAKKADVKLYASKGTLMQFLRTLCTDGEQLAQFSRAQTALLDSTMLPPASTSGAPSAPAAIAPTVANFNATPATSSSFAPSVRTGQWALSDFFCARNDGGRALPNPPPPPPSRSQPGSPTLPILSVLPAGAFAHHHASHKRKQAEQCLRDQSAIAAASALQTDKMTASSSSSAASTVISGLSVTLPSLASIPSHLRLVGHAGDPFPLRASWAIGGVCGPFISAGKSQRAVRSCNRVD